MTSSTTSTTSTTTTNNQQLGAQLLSALGVGGGLNINTIVSQLVTAEGQPVTNQINSQIAAVNTKLSGIGQLQSALFSFQDTVKSLRSANSFQTNTVTSSNTAVVSVTSGAAGAKIGSHTIAVTGLASAQSSIAKFDSSVTSSSVIGQGSLTFTMGSGSSFNVSIDSTNNTLSGIANAINNATGNPGVSASIINVNTGNGSVPELVLSSQNPGTANGFTITGVDDGTNNNGLSKLFSTNLISGTPAANAYITVDGQSLTESSNTVTDVIPGVTLNLQSLSPVDNTTTPATYTPTTIGVSLNTSAVTSSVNNFVSAYNNLNTIIQSLQAYGGVGGTNGALFGDPNLEYIAHQVRTLASGVVSSANSGYNSLAMIGVTIDNTGTMAVDSTKLSAALAANTQSVSNVFTSSNGVANQFATVITTLTGSFGPLGNENTTLNAQLTNLNKQQTAENAYLASYQATLQKQYSSMQTLVSQYSSTSSFLTSWVNSQSGSTSSSKG